MIATMFSNGSSNGKRRIDEDEKIENEPTASETVKKTKIVLNEGSIYRDEKRILVTGGCGFIGSHLVDRLMQDERNEVICVDNCFSGRKQNIAQWLNHPRFEYVRHDVTEPLLLEVDQIYHLACPASPVFYQHNGIKTIKTNVMGTLNMLGIAKRTGARFLISSTSEVYGDPSVHPQPEEYWGNVNPIGIRRCVVVVVLLFGVLCSFFVLFVFISYFFLFVIFLHLSHSLSLSPYRLPLLLSLSLLSFHHPLSPSCYDEGKRLAEALAFEYHRQNGVDIRVARIFNTYVRVVHRDVVLSYISLLSSLSFHLSPCLSFSFFFLSLSPPCSHSFSQSFPLPQSSCLSLLHTQPGPSHARKRWSRCE